MIGLGHQPALSRSATRGFTIIEVATVIVIIGILAAITIVSYDGIQERAELRVLESDVASAAEDIALSATRTSDGRYPASATEFNNAGIHLNGENGVVYNYYYNADTNTFCVEGLYEDNETLIRSSLGSEQTLREGGCTDNGLVGKWLMNGSPDDSSKNALASSATSLVNAPNAAYKANSAYTFNGSTSGLTVSHNDLLHPDAAMTISTWIKPSAWNGSSATAFVSKRLSNGTTGYFFFYLTSSGTVNIDFGGVAAANRWNTGYTPPLNQWTHLVVTATAAKRQLYVNGVLNSETTEKTTAFTANSENLTIGRKNDGAGGYNFAGQIDDTRIYNRVLAATEVSTLYHDGAQ